MPAMFRILTNAACHGIKIFLQCCARGHIQAFKCRATWAVCRIKRGQLRYTLFPEPLHSQKIPLDKVKLNQERSTLNKCNLTSVRCPAPTRRWINSLYPRISSLDCKLPCQIRDYKSNDPHCCRPFNNRKTTSGNRFMRRFNNARQSPRIGVSKIRTYNAKSQPRSTGTLNCQSRKAKNVT